MRTRYSILNFATGILFTAVTTLTALVTTPLLLRWLGSQRYGDYRMIVGCLGYLTLLDFGLSGALSPLLARALGQGDRRALRGTLAAGMRAYLKLTAAILGIGLALTPLVVWLITRGLPAPVPPGLLGDLRRAWAVALLSFVILALAPLRTLAEARQRGYWVNMLLTAQALLVTGLSLLWAWAGWGVTGQALASTTGVVAFYLVLAWAGLRSHPDLLSRAALAAPADAGARRALWALSVPSLLLNISGRLGLLSDELVAGAFLGPALGAASLSLTIRLATLAQAQLQAIGSASWAGLAEIHARGDRETFNRRLVELTSLVAVLGLAALGPIAAYGRHFFGLWVGGSAPFGGEAVTLVASANALLLGLFSLWGWCFAGTAQMQRLVRPVLLATAINVAASLLLTWRYGLVGPVLGTLVANLAVSAWYLPLLLRRVFGIPLRALAGAVGRPLAWGLPYTAGLWWAAHAHRPRGWPGLAAEMGLAAVAFLAWSAVAVLSPTDRALWRLRLAGLLRPRGPRRPAAAEPAGLVSGGPDGGGDARR